MLLQMLTARFGRKVSPRSRPSTRPCLEELESRLTPSFMTGTYTNVSVQVSPSFFSGTVTETITATVTNAPSFDPFTGITTPVPSGATPPSGGMILFNLNNLQQSAQLNSSGQATVSFKLPIFAVLTSQTLSAQYQGFTDSNNDVFQESGFLSALYMNYNNLLFPATLTFSQLTPQQVQPTVNMTTSTTTALANFNTAQGETDSFGIVSFLYIDPGTINQIQAFGFTVPGSFAAQLNAFGPQIASLSSSSSM
jgi:hypothetical protein